MERVQLELPRLVPAEHKCFKYSEQPVQPEHDPTTCVVCYEDYQETETSRFYCVNSACDTLICRACLTHYFESMIRESFNGMYLRLRCPHCLCHLNQERWEKFVSPDLVKVYKQRAKVLCTILCPACHRPHTLIPKVNERSVTLQLQASQIELLPDVVALAVQYAEHQIQCKELLVFIQNCLGETAESMIQSIIQLLQDRERQSTLMLHSLRQNPKTWTLCCGAEVCFSCKSSGHHPGQSCAEYQAELARDHMRYYGSHGAISILSCPSCNIQLMKGDGCDSINCVCGESFCWSEHMQDSLETRINNLLNEHQLRPTFRRLLPYMKMYVARSQYRKIIRHASNYFVNAYLQRWAHYELQDARVATSMQHFLLMLRQRIVQKKFRAMLRRKQSYFMWMYKKRCIVAALENPRTRRVMQKVALSLHQCVTTRRFRMILRNSMPYLQDLIIQQKVKYLLASHPGVQVSFCGVREYLLQLVWRKRFRVAVLSSTSGFMHQLRQLQLRQYDRLHPEEVLERQEHIASLLAMEI